MKRKILKFIIFIIIAIVCLFEVGVFYVKKWIKLECEEKIVFRASQSINIKACECYVDSIDMQVKYDIFPRYLVSSILNGEKHPKSQSLLNGFEDKMNSRLELCVKLNLIN